MKWKIIDWIIRIMISLAFVMASIGKLTSHPGVAQMFERFGLPEGMHLLIGAVELLGAVLILIPKTRKVSIIFLGLVVIGAAAMHLAHDPIHELTRPVIFAVFLVAAWHLPKKLS